MTDDQLRTLLREHVTYTETPFSIRPDESIRRGRGTRLRRRQWAAGLAVACSAAAGVGTPALVDRLSGPEESQVAAEPNQSFGGGLSAEPTAPDTRRKLALAPSEFPGAFATLFPGSVTDLPLKEPTTPIVDFLWNGYAVRVGFQKAEYVVGVAIDPDTGLAGELGRWQDAGTPIQRCQRSAERVNDCTVEPDGSVTRTLSYTNRGLAMNFAWMYTTDGWDVWLSAANAPDTKDVEPIAPDAPFTPQQLLRAAQSEIWFR